VCTGKALTYFAFVLADPNIRGEVIIPDPNRNQGHGQEVGQDQGLHCIVGMLTLISGRVCGDLVQNPGNGNANNEPEGQGHESMGQGIVVNHS